MTLSLPLCHPVLASLPNPASNHPTLSLFSWHSTWGWKLRDTQIDRGRLQWNHPMPSICLFILVIFVCSLRAALGADPYVFYDWTVSYITASPLGVKQQVLSLALSFSSFGSSVLNYLVLVLVLFNFPVVFFEYVYAYLQWNLMNFSFCFSNWMIPCTKVVGFNLMNSHTMRNTSSIIGLLYVYNWLGMLTL